MRKGVLASIVCFLICFFLLSHQFLTVNGKFSLYTQDLGDNDLIWSYTFGDNHSLDAAYSVIQCEDGGYFITGSTRAEGTLDVFILRLNELGELMWNNTLIREGEQIAKEVIECVSGGYAIIGYSQEQLSNGTLLEYNACLIRIHANGSFAWTQTIGTNSSQQAYSIVECNAGGFAFVGYTTNSVNGDLDFWLVRTNSQGQLLWNRTYGSTGNDICYSLVEKQYGGFVLVGNKHNLNSGDQDGWIINTYIDGNALWNRTYGRTRYDVCNDVIRRSSRVYAIVGTTENPIYGGFDAFVLIAEEDGAFLWNTTIGDLYNQEAYSITNCQDGGYAITGYTIEQTQSGTKTHLLVSRIDYSGNMEWTKRYGGAGREIGWSIIQGSNHDFIIAGTTESNLEDNIGTDIWIIRIPDASSLPGSPNFEIIFLGIITGVIIITMAALIFVRSKRNLRYVETEASRRQLQKDFIIPRPIEELTPSISGIVRCRKCGTITKRKDLKCSHCSALIHRCLFCDNTLTTGDVVIFCPGCKNLSHANEMLSWLKKRRYCPRCRFRLKKS